jgi:peptidoglycan/LPS O-acetylase OafA/YrhL
MNSLGRVQPEVHSCEARTIDGSLSGPEELKNRGSGSTPASEKTEFVNRLEALRGVAALMVAGGHSFSVLVPHGWQTQARSFALVFLNGYSAVTVFFVLSGFVLGRSLARARSSFQVNTATFIIRRFFRIYPAFLMASLLIAGSILLLDFPMRFPAGVSSWFSDHWRRPITPVFFINNLLFKVHDLNPPSWTLRAELTCSCVLPFVFLVCRWGFWSRAGVLGTVVAWSIFGRGNLSAFLFMFQLGLLVPDAGQILIKTLNRSTSLARWLAPVTWITLCAGFSFFPNRYDLANLVAGVSAATFIAALLYGPELPWFRFLDWAPTRLYGRISYSFYLYHTISLYFVAKLVFLVCPAEAMADWFIPSSVVLLCVSTALATPIAWLSHRFIEKPGIAFSRSLCNWIIAKSAMPSEPIQSRPAPSP